MKRAHLELTGSIAAKSAQIASQYRLTAVYLCAIWGLEDALRGVRKPGLGIVVIKVFSATRIRALMMGHVCSLEIFIRKWA